MRDTPELQAVLARYLSTTDGEFHLDIDAMLHDLRGRESETKALRMVIRRAELARAPRP